MTPEQEFRELYLRMHNLCEKNDWGDPFSYARSKEIYAAPVLGHKVAPDYSGADAYDKDGNPCEYKSTIAKSPKGAYTGVSVQDTWEEQEEYLLQEKIGPYNHYYNRFEDGKMVESWMIPGNVVHNILLPKFKRKYPTILEKKDPRLSADVSWTDIKKSGKKVYFEQTGGRNET